MRVDDLRVLAEEQAALRRVATLVARGATPEEVFAAVAEEAGRLLPVDSASMCRYEPDGTLTFVAQWGSVVAHFPVGSRWAVGGHNLGTLVFETGRPAGPGRRLCRKVLGRPWRRHPRDGSPLGGRDARHRGGTALGPDRRRLDRRTADAARYRGAPGLVH